jgi:UDP:flavonoid glycosyltransferase YjiC (YdhE family)
MRSARHLHPSTDQIIRDEQAVLRRTNGTLARWNQAPLERLGRLYGDVDECFLNTFEELDHCPSRPTGARFWGPITGSDGGGPTWPVAGQGKRVFGYLKPFAGLSRLLQALRDRGNPTLIYPDGINATVRKRFECDTLQFARHRLDPTRTARECDLAILNATHGTTCDVLLAGKPILQIPIFGEQELMAEAVCRIDAGKLAWPTKEDRSAMEDALDQLLGDARCVQGAQAFAARHRDFDPVKQRAEMLERACQLLKPIRGTQKARHAHSFSNVLLSQQPVSEL